MKEPAGQRDKTRGGERRQTFPQEHFNIPLFLRPSTLTWVLELPADDVVDEERLPDDFNFLHSLHRFGDEQQVRKQDTVHVHLRTNALHEPPSQDTLGALQGPSECEAFFTRLSLPSFILRAPSRCSWRISSGDVPLMGAIRSKWLNSFRI